MHRLWYFARKCRILWGRHRLSHSRFLGRCSDWYRHRCWSFEFGWHCMKRGKHTCHPATLSGRYSGFHIFWFCCSIFEKRYSSHTGFRSNEVCWWGIGSWARCQRFFPLCRLHYRCMVWSCMNRKIDKWCCLSCNRCALPGKTRDSRKVLKLDKTVLHNLDKSPQNGNDSPQLPTYNNNHKVV